MTESVANNDLNRQTKLQILGLTENILNSQNVEDIIADYDLGRIPESGDLHHQMALVKLTELLLGHALVEAPIVSEVVKNGRFLRSLNFSSIT